MKLGERVMDYMFKRYYEFWKIEFFFHGDDFCIKIMNEKHRKWRISYIFFINIEET